MITKRIAKDGLLLAIALIIFLVEMQIPAIVPIPGIKLGLSNIITIYAMFAVGPVDTLIILLLRIALGSIFSGQIMALVFSLAGGILCYLVMLILRKILSPKQIWVCGVIGAIMHNIGQLIVAIIVLRNTAVVTYLPVLILSGIVTGLITGICAQIITNRIRGKQISF